jgi:hypothetical protein
MQEIIRNMPEEQKEASKTRRVQQYTLYPDSSFPNSQIQAGVGHSLWPAGAKSKGTYGYVYEASHPGAALGLNDAL